MPHRFYLPSITVHGDTVSLNDQETIHQLTNVLRLKKNDTFIIFNSKAEYECIIKQFTKHTLSATILGYKEINTNPTRTLTLYQSLLKKDKFEWILQKGTELGVSAFVPIICDNTITRTITPNKQKRYNTIIKEATEQCGGLHVPELLPQKTYSEALRDAQKENGIVLIAWEGQKDQAFEEIIDANQHKYHLFIGPEGGFTAQEIALLQKLSIRSISLGKRILRAETAAIAAICEF